MEMRHFEEYPVQGRAMKLIFIGAGAILSSVGLAIWLVPFYHVAHTNWIPMSTPVSLVSNFCFRTNCSANTPDRYGVYIVFDSASLDLKDDTPEDTFKHPLQIPANVQLQVAGRHGLFLETNLTQATLASEGDVVTYRLGRMFDLQQQDEVSIVFSDTPSSDSVGTGNPRLEIQLADALYAGRVMSMYAGKRFGIPVVTFGLISLIIGLFLPSNRLRKEVT